MPVIAQRLAEVGFARPVIAPEPAHLNAPQCDQTACGIDRCSDAAIVIAGTDDRIRTIPALDDADVTAALARDSTATQLMQPREAAPSKGL